MSTPPADAFALPPRSSNGSADHPVTVSVADVSKDFTGTRALSNVSLQIRRGEIHALVGGNGSGKSTLVKALAGVQPADTGMVTFDGEEIAARDLTPALSSRHGVRVVHQDLGIFPSMSVTENLALGRGYELGGFGRIRWGGQRRRTAQILEKFEIPTTPDALMEDLSASVRAQVAIARALQDREEGGRGLLILDEPTASLPAHEVDELLTALRRFKAQGQSILYISHRLSELLELTDRVTALRDGVVIGTHDTAELDETALINLIVAGKTESTLVPPPALPIDAPAVVEIRGLSAGPLQGVDLTVRRGEIVGVAGLLGSGRSELLRAIFGDYDIRAGTIQVDGKKRHARHPKDAIDDRVALVPENRLEDAAFLDLPVYLNMAVIDLGEYRVAGRISVRKMRAAGREKVRRYRVKVSDEGALLSTLSGGNQQKTVVGRWLSRAPGLLLLDEPTQGVDVGARADIYRLIHDAVADGAGAIIVASDFEELAHVVHRAVVLRGGRLVAEVSGDDLTPHRLLQLTSEGTSRAS
jgi:ribose transport system ATP-binding protein